MSLPARPYLGLEVELPWPWVTGQPDSDHRGRFANAEKLEDFLHGRRIEDSSAYVVALHEAGCSVKGTGLRAWRRLGGSENEKDEMDRAAVRRLIVNPLAKAGERGASHLEPRYPGVRERKAPRDRGGYGPLALQDNFDRALGGDTIGGSTCPPYEELDEIGPVLDVRVKHHGLWPESLRDRDCARRLELVPDIADELLDNVLQGENADLGTHGVQDDSHVLSRVLELTASDFQKHVLRDVAA